MRRLFSLYQSGIVFVLLVGSVIELLASPPPINKKSVDRRPTIRVALERAQGIDWHIGENFARGLLVKEANGKARFLAVQAVDVSELEETARRSASRIRSRGPKAEPRFFVWKKTFDQSGGRATKRNASVVDENVFTDLRKVGAEEAEELDLDGTVIGRIKLEQYDPVELTHFLIDSGIVDVIPEDMAVVEGTHFTSERGNWFSLRSRGQYWTNKVNMAEYNFGIHIAEDGTIRMINPKYIGRLLEKVGE